MKYSTIRKEYQHHGLNGMVFVDPYATLLSPLTTKLFLKLGWIPNVVTLCMIGSGILGAVFFALPFLWAKILGTVLIHLWYVLDCSDGEVARITKRFSKFGTEIDFTAHIVNHPLFLAAFLLTLLQSNTGISQLTLCAVFFGILALNMIYRNLSSFGLLYDLKTEKNASAVQPGRWGLKQLIVFCFNIFVQLPNFALLFPIVSFISSQAAFWYAVIVLGFNVLFVPYGVLSWLRRIVNQ